MKYTGRVRDVLSGRELGAICVDVDEPDTGWRQRISGFLRALADRADGRSSLAIRISTSPGVPDVMVDRAMDIAMERFTALIVEDMRINIIEGMFESRLKNPPIQHEEGK